MVLIQIRIDYRLRFLLFVEIIGGAKPFSPLSSLLSRIYGKAMPHSEMVPTRSTPDNSSNWG